MNTQKLATLALSAEQYSAIDAHQSELETHFTGLVSLTAEQKKLARTMGLRSEAFCRRVLEVMQQNPHLLPPKVQLADALSDLAQFERLRPRVERMTKLQERAIDTLFGLGSNVFRVALECYNQLRRFGDNEGLKQACIELGGMFVREGAKAKARRAAVRGTPPDPGAGPVG
jgi:hypothetical protein